MSEDRSALYFGSVVHRRVKPVRHRLRHRIFAALFDLDALPHIQGRLRFLSHNRFNLFSFYDRDHGAGGDALRPYVETQLAAAGVDLDGGAIRLLCSPRVLGYVFNPLSVYFCHGRDGALAALLYEVNNTFGERHSYLIPVKPGSAEPIRQSCAKRFYVSPFMDMAMTYHFRILSPGDALAVAITECDAEGPVLHAALAGRRRSLTDGNLLRAFFGYPLLTLAVIAGIHWHGLRLWRKGLPLLPRPAPPENPVTIVSPLGNERSLDVVPAK